eukprot:SAG31_NODE_47506_length_239_cov_2.078571_1_plen_30_part_01
MAWHEYVGRRLALTCARPVLPEFAEGGIRL